MYCTKCGRKLNEDDLFCPKCGAKVSGENAAVSDEVKSVTGNMTKTTGQQNKAAEKKNGSGLIWGLAAAVVVLMILVVVLAVTLTRSSGDSETANSAEVISQGADLGDEAENADAVTTDMTETSDKTEVQETEAFAEGTETSESEEETVSMFEGMEPIEVVYGTYLYDNGEGYQMEAEVSFSSGEGYDYIIIDALSVYGGHYIADFYGTLDAPVSDGSYPAYDENYGTYIYVTFYEGGMNIWVSENSEDYNTYSLLGGDYTLTEALDLNNVG